MKRPLRYALIALGAAGLVAIVTFSAPFRSYLNERALQPSHHAAEEKRTAVIATWIRALRGASSAHAAGEHRNAVIAKWKSELRGENCGTIKRSFPDSAPTASDYAPINECIELTRREHKPFYFAVQGMGIDAYLSIGLIGRENGLVQRYRYEADCCCGPCGPSFTMADCPEVKAWEPVKAETWCGLDKPDDFWRN